MAFKGHYLYIHFFTRCFCQTTFTRETQPAVHAVQPLVRFVNRNSTEVSPQSKNRSVRFQCVSRK